MMDIFEVQEFTTITLDKPRRMIFSYSAIKKMQKKSKNMNLDDLDQFEYMVYMSLIEDDKTLKMEDIEVLINIAGIKYVKEKLMETVERDINGLQEKKVEVLPEIKND